MICHKPKPAAMKHSTRAIALPLFMALLFLPIAGFSQWTTSGNDIYNSNSGSVGIGTSDLSDNNYKLFVETGVRTRKVRVDQVTWPDYVFSPGYKLLTLRELEQYLKIHSHLPEVPSACEVEEKGIDLGDTQALLLKKIEELTLYIIDIGKRVDALEAENARLKEENSRINN